MYYIWAEKNSEPKMKNENLTGNGECVIIGNTQARNEQKISTDTIRKNIIGIYKIINKINGKYYIGSSSNIQRRKIQHFNKLRQNIHENQHLQYAYNKYGEFVFDLIIIEEVLDYKNILFYEQKYLDIAKTEKNKCYNISFIAGKIDMTPEVCEKISYYLKNKYKNKENHPWFGKKHSPETLLKQSLCKRGKNNPNFGKKFSIETRNKLSERHRGILHWNFNKHWSNEVKAKMSKNHKDQHGNKNPKFDNSIYIFRNVITNEIFTGTRFDFYKKYNLSQNGAFRLVKQKTNIFKNWVLNTNPHFL